MFKRREILIIKLLVLAICVSSVPTTIAFAQETVTNVLQTTGAAVNVNLGDTTEPVFNSISIDKGSATNGDKLTVTADASDDISGIDRITVYYYAPVGSEFKVYH